MENPFKWCHYEGEIILLYVGWYLQYTLIYRDLEEMMSKSGAYNNLAVGSMFCAATGQADAIAFEEK